MRSLPTAWFFDGHCLRDVDGRVRWTERPWEEDGIIIVSRHLIARADRRAGLLAVQRPWDAVLVDETHAARRRVFGGGGGPNQLLGLLQALRARAYFMPLAADSNTDATRPTRGARLVTAVWTRRSGVGTLVQPRRLSRIL